MATKAPKKKIEDALSFAERFKRTKLIVCLLFAGAFLSLAVDVLGQDTVAGLKLAKYAAVVASAYILGQSIVDGLRYIKKGGDA